jgi:quercetin dioxygenase-like cupin family protein
MGALHHVNLVAGLALGVMMCGAYGADDLPTGAVRITAEELKWGPGRVPGQEVAPLVGDQSKPGPYVVRIKFPPNYTLQAHTHSDDRTYTVISGVWYVGYGEKLDSANLKALPAGSFHTEPANVSHFVVTKNEGAVIQVAGTGPTGTNFVDAAHAPKK